MPFPRRPHLILALGVLASAPGLATASGGVDQDQARRAVDRGEIQPLDKVMTAVRAGFPGEVLALKLKRRRDRWLYEFKILSASGKRSEVTIDAKTLSILEAEDDD